MKVVLARFLSPQWLDDLRRAAAAGPGSAGGPAECTVTIQQVVTDAPQGEVAYVVRLAGGRLEVSPGRAEDADVTITEDYATAVAVSSGELTARQALLAGRIQLRGDTNALLAGQAAMQAAQAGVDHLRAGTSY